MFDWFPITQGKYLTAEQYLLLIEVLAHLILCCFWKTFKYSQAFQIQLSLLVMSFSHFNYGGYAPLIIIITINIKRIRQLLILLLIYLCTQDVCFAMHNYNQGFIFNLFEVQFSTSLSRCFTNINKHHVYTTLSEHKHQIFVNYHTDYTNSSIVICNAIEYWATLQQLKDRTLHHALIDVTEYNNTIYLKHHNQIYGPYFYNVNESNPSLVVGGDVGSSKLAEQAWQQMINLPKIDAIWIGGDIAYDNGMPTCYLCWDVFLNSYEDVCQHHNKLIPLILAVGNHDVARVQNPQLIWNNQFNNKLPLYFRYFPQHTNSLINMESQLTYFKHNVGNLVLISLDSYYVATPAQQQQFLFDSIVDGYTYVSYHVPVVLLDNTTESNEFVIELAQYFNKVPLAFEHHKHNRKRSIRMQFQVLMNGRIRVNNGHTIFLGNGAMGVQSGSYPQHGIIEQSGNDPHFWYVNDGNVSCISVEGVILDQVGIM